MYDEIKNRIKERIIPKNLAEMSDSDRNAFRTTQMGKYKKILNVSFIIYAVNGMLWVWALSIAFFTRQLWVMIILLPYCVAYFALMMASFSRIEITMPAFSILIFISLAFGATINILNSVLFVFSFFVHYINLCYIVLNDNIKAVPLITTVRMEIKKRERATAEYVPPDLAEDERLMALREAMLSGEGTERK